MLKSRTGDEVKSTILFDYSMVSATKVIIVLGQLLHNDNSLRESLIHRLQGGLKLCQITSNSVIILSGGITKNNTLSEADAMNQWIDVNVSPLKSYNNVEIILEKESKNTIENALNCKDLLCHNCTTSTQSPQSITIVTSDFHIPRTQCIFNHIFNEINPKITCKLIHHPTDSLLNRIIYRPIRSDRPIDINDWSLKERLEIEKRAILNIPKDMAKYSTRIPQYTRSKQPHPTSPHRRLFSLFGRTPGVRGGPSISRASINKVLEQLKHVT